MIREGVFCFNDGVDDDGSRDMESSKEKGSFCFIVVKVQVVQRK
jgi:hypothetical protein